MVDRHYPPRRWLPVLLVAAGAAAVSLFVAIWLSGRTAMWRDEYATALYRALSPGDLWAATTHVDAVHYPYYLLMHGLSPLLGTDLAMRIPSIVAFSASAAVVTLIAARWWGTLPAALAGIAFIVNPLTMGAAVLARSYMLSILAVTLAILVLDVAIRNRRRAGISAWMPWVGYGLASVIAVLLQPFASLSIVATIVLAIGRRRSLLAWTLATLPAGVATVALLARARDQSAQVSWLGAVTPRAAVENTALASGIAVGRGIGFDVLAVALLMVMSALAIVASSAANRRSLAAAAALTFTPPVILFAISVLVSPVLTGRYLSWIAVGAALLLGGSAHAALHGRRHRVSAVLAGALVVVLAIPFAVTAKRTLDPPGRLDNFPETAARIQAAAHPGDILIVTQRYEAGGVAYGMARASADEGYRLEILASAPFGPRVVADVREITEAVPLRSVPFTGSKGQADRTLWVAGLTLPETSDLADADPVVRACLAAIEAEAFTFIDGVRLYSVPCPASGE